jgi:hypothetical protein
VLRFAGVARLWFLRVADACLGPQVLLCLTALGVPDFAEHLHGGELRQAAGAAAERPPGDRR